MPDTLPVDILSWVLALLPLLVLIVLLIVLRWKAPQAGPIGMFLAAAIALLVFRSPFVTLAVASAKGIWDAIFVLFVVWPALLLYQVTQKAGAFEALRVGIRRFSRNRLFLVLGFGWVFASFFQGIAGFGTPVAVTAPLLLALGVRPLYAVVVPLIGHAWANLFGTLAVAWLAMLRVIELESVRETAFQAGIMLWISNLFAGLAIAWLFGRMKATVHALPLVLLVSLIHGGIQQILLLWNPVISGLVAVTVALLALYPLSFWKRYSEPVELDSPIMAKREEEEENERPVMGLWMAVLPYLVLAVTAVLISAIPPVERFMSRVSVGFPFPETSTGYGVVNEAARPYSPFDVLTHPGAFLLVAAGVSWIVYRARGYYHEWEKAEHGIIRGLVTSAVPSSIAIATFLVMSRIMGETGQTAVLARGISEVAPTLLYIFLSNWIGILGAFMTSSNTASNILFAPLQQSVTEAEQALSVQTVIAAQGAGGAIGNAIAPANVVLGTGAIRRVGMEASVLRIVLVWAALVAVIVGTITVLLNGLVIL